MATRRPPAGIIPAGHPSLAELWRSRQARSAPFRHLQDLIGILSTVDEAVLEDPKFLERSVLVDGITPTTTPKDLLESFPLLSPRAAVAVRDSETGHRVGLVVFSDADDSTTAMKLEPRRGFYSYCIPANCPEDSRDNILKALELQSIRSPTGELLQSLVPPQYIIEDEDMDLHLRCLFLSGASGVSGGAYGLCRAARDELLATGPVRAVILHRAGDAAVVVFDDAETVELLPRRAPRMLLRLGLSMVDSSLFPLPASAASWETPLLDRLLPNFLMDYSFMCRVLLLTGLDTEYADAAEIAYRIQQRLDLIYMDHALEAVMVYRCQKLAVVVVGCLEDVEVLLQEPSEVWAECFGQKIALVGAFGEPVFCPRYQPPQIQSDISSVVGTEVFQHVREQIIEYLKSRRRGETGPIARCLIALCALRDPTVVKRKDFPDRALLLSGVHLSWSDICTGLSYFGALDDVVLDENRKVALAVFRSWSGAARLLLRSPEAWALLGFSDCRRAPEVEDADTIAEVVVAQLSQCQSRPSPVLLE